MINIFDFITRSQLFKKLEVDELLFVEYHCIGEEERIRYWTDYNGLVYIIKGKKKWETIHGTYFVKAGEAIFIRKGACIVNQYFDEDLCALVIFTPDEFIKNVLQRHPLEFNMEKTSLALDNLIPVKVDDILSTCFLSVYNYFTQSTKPPKELLKLKFTELIISIMVSRDNLPLASCFSKINRESSVSIEEIMNENFAYNLKMEEFARLTARSLSTFKRDFIKIFHVPPGKWLTGKRLEYAKFLLETSTKNIQEIVFDSGFENTSHFYRIFKNKFGITPLRYREKRHMKRIA